MMKCLGVKKVGTVLSSPTRGGRSVGIVRSRTEDMEFNPHLRGFAIRKIKFTVAHTCGGI
jgi:hypothetical protein